MNDDTAKRMFDDAHKVVNGFAKVRDQQARDVLTLLAEREQHLHAIRCLNNKLSEAQSASWVDNFFKKKD